MISKEENNPVNPVHPVKKFFMQIEFVPRKSAVLAASSLACLSDVASINLTASCAHGCIYCYANGYSTQPSTGTVRVYSNLSEKLKTELLRKRKMPKTVYFSPSSDLFQPIPELQIICYEILDILFHHGLNVAFLTKGFIPEPHFELLRKYSSQVQAQIGLISCNENILAVFEPNAAEPGVRLEQIQKLIGYNIPTTVRLDPIIPGVTDDEKTLTDLCRVVSRCGVRSLAASVLFLRPAIKDSLYRNISNSAVFETIFQHFADAKRQPIHAEHSSIVAIPLEKRLRIYERLQTIAESFNLNVHICGCKNQDVPVNSFHKNCHISGSWNKTETKNLLDLY